MRIVVIGGGIVGLATARALSTCTPTADIVLLEKEDELATHQTGRNSGVIHAGVYYKPGSRKAELCLRGRQQLMDLCSARGIPFTVTGKLIVALSASELAPLAELERRSIANGVSARRLDAAGVRDIEPYCVAEAALHVPTTGVVDFGQVARAIADELSEHGAEIRLGSAVVGGGRSGTRLHIELAHGAPLEADVVVNCAGLYADRVAIMLGGPDVTGGAQIVPFRGEYFNVHDSKAHLVRALIYPVPDARFPFLGVHLTRGVDGHVHAGPNAVLALRREGYRWRDWQLGELAEVLRFEGFRRMARRYWRAGLGEMARSLNRRAFAAAVGRLVPMIGAEDLRRGSAGVRAQAVSADGELVDDFLFARSHRALHVLNAPSPAATASLAIGEHIANELADTFPDLVGSRRGES